MEMITLVPTRGRPHNAVELLAAHDELSSASRLLFIVDYDDPKGDEYVFELGDDYVITCNNESRGMAKPLNYVAHKYHDKYKYFAFLGDDHRPRTADWDVKLIAALQQAPSLAYGNDLLQGKRLPTMVAMTSDIVTALQGMVPPNMRHLYLDNFWKKLGEDLGSLTYLEDVIIEHMHPVAGKAAWDEGYVAVNADEVYSADALAYRNYIGSEAYEVLLKKLRR
jgi:hypothetical protein